VRFGAARADARAFARRSTARAVPGRPGGAQARWDLLVSGHPARAWDLLSPGARELQTREEYAALVGNRPVRWMGAEVSSAKCDGDSCTVNVKVRYKAEIPQSSAGPIESVAYLDERWIRSDGEWFLVPEKTAGGELR
jgi:hypothetical protein